MTRASADAGNQQAAATHPAPAESPPPFLDVEDPDAGRREVPLAKESTWLGRSSESDVQVLQRHVSKHHADIVRRGDRFVIVDAGSKAGVFVNGARVDEAPLADGDVITLGFLSSPKLVFRSGGASSAQTSAARLLATLVTHGEGPSLENLARFLEFGRLLGGRLPLTEILENVVDLATRITGAERGFLVLESEGGALDFAVARARSGLPIPRAEIVVSETLVREALARGAPRIVADIREAEDLAGLKSVVALRLGSAVALPLCRFAVHENGEPRPAPGGQAFGVLYLDSREIQGELTRIDQGILETLARDASSVIENARLFREAEEKRRIEAEMERAREIQAALLPQEYWAEAHFEVSGRSVPSLRLGGDYLDQIRFANGKCGFVVADVAGKGVGAALLAAALQGALASESFSDQPLATLAERLNRAICRLAPDGKFVTFVCCVLSPQGDLAYVNAGHPPPMAVAPGGAVRLLSTGDMALGVRERNRYQEGRLLLEPGEVVVLYTDGVTEANDRDGEFFEEPRLEQVLKESLDLPAEGIVEAILESVVAFYGGAHPRDDITLLAVRYLGEGRGPARAGRGEAGQGEAGRGDA